MALGLGLTSFGGPIAHLGYFERAYVRKLRWLPAEDYASIVALCAMLPGPASSQVGLLVGLQRAGWAGALAAWAGFTLPSAMALFAFARLAPRLHGPTLAALLHGLQLVAVAVVAQAVWRMARQLCADVPRACIGLAAALLMLADAGARAQLAALALGAAGGVLCWRFLRTLVLPPMPAPPATRVSARTAGILFALFLALLAGLPLLGHAAPHSLAALAAIFYQAGALVFGGGHVVLPLLRDSLVPAGWLSDDAFLAGYGAAQAIPGPLFTVSAYLGAIVAPAGEALPWAATALVFMFLPGLLLALAGHALWTLLAANPAARGALAGANAATVGVLAAALYTPVCTSAVTGARDAAIALAALLLLERGRLPPLAVACLCIAACLAT